MSMSTARALALAAATATCAAAADLPVALEEAALDADDACLVDPTGEGCATALLQLRGAQKFQEDNKLNSTGGSGFCCFSGSSKADVCGSCYPASKAKEGEYCANPSHCGGCSGTWCTMQCVFSYSDEDNKCGSANSVAEPDSWCSSSEEKCLGCGDGSAWCVKQAEEGPTIEPTSAPAEEEEEEEPTQEPEEPTESPTPSEGGEAEEEEDATDAPEQLYETGDGEGYWGSGALLQKNSSAPAGGAPSFCCFSGDGNDKCGSCYPGAKAEKASFCDSEETCGTCSETAVWCTMQCVFASSDLNDVCNTAYESAIAESDNWCANSEERCESSQCGGTWCGVNKAQAEAKMKAN